MWPKPRDYRLEGSMAALFKRGLRLGPVAALKMWPKVKTIAVFKTWLELSP